MKPNRIFASASLLLSGAALVSAANVSSGDEGVVRMSSLAPQPPAVEAPSVAPAPQEAPVYGTVRPYFERTFAANGSLGAQAMSTEPAFGPLLTFETGIGSGVGYDSGYQRANARLPFHLVPNMDVLFGDIAASVTWDGRPVFAGGGIFRTYDPSLNRIFGINGYFDYDEGYGNKGWDRFTVGFESLGKYVDVRGNAYIVSGDDSYLISSTVQPGLQLMRQSVYTERVDVRDNAYSGFDLEIGGPTPVLGQYGLNTYPGIYYLENGYGGDTVGFQIRWEALITQNLTVNTYLTHDGKFDTNAWVNLQYEIPNYRRKRALRDRGVRERLMDPVVRATRIHSRIDTTSHFEAVINQNTGNAWSIINVDPNLAAAGDGSWENPFNTMEAAKLANIGGVDIIRIRPRDDDSTTNLTLSGGMGLFDGQILMSSLATVEVAPGEFLPLDATATTLPIISDPGMVAGGSLIRLANNNSILGLSFDASNTDGTAFGTALLNPLPITDALIAGNEFHQYSTGVSLQDVSGYLNINSNLFNGTVGASQTGLDLSIAGGSTADLLLEGNSAVANGVAGLRIIAQNGSTLNADDPNGFRGPVTGILGNTISGTSEDANGNGALDPGEDLNGNNQLDGSGIVTIAQTGATINAIVSGNTVTGSFADGFSATADGANWNLAEMSLNDFSGNGGNGAFLHYLNGGVFRAVSEDTNGDGTLQAGEDLNGNGRLDQGIVSNLFADNQIAGVCIFGEDISFGAFDIGGPDPALGNQFIGNRNAGLAVDLADAATAQMDVVNNLLSSVGSLNTTPTLTYVLDFVDPGQSITDPFFGGTLAPFDVTGFGFAGSDYDLVTNAVLDSVRTHYYGIPTVSQDNRSPMPDGQELDISFVLGDVGSAPSIGATEYYYAAIGQNGAAPAGILGIAFGSAVRDAAGNGPAPGFASGDLTTVIYSDAINGIGGLTPADVVNLPNLPPNWEYDVPGAGGGSALADALTSGNLTFTRNALAGTISHEIGHTLSLSHADVAGSVTPSGVAPIMGTGAIDMPAQARITAREFSYSAFDSQSGGAPVFHVQQLMSALGTRAASAGGSSGDGIRITGTGASVLQPSTFLRNTITRNSGDGLSINMSGTAQAQGVTVQGNTIQNNSGAGVVLAADGGAFIDADGTIGGSGTLALGGSVYSQGNTISGNQSDGIRALASNGGTIHGNAINNQIAQNAGNGIALLIDNGGTVDFGTIASNRIISGNAVSGNGGAGLFMSSNVSASSEADMLATVHGNSFTSNVGGGIVSSQNGPNNNPPNPPAVINNNRTTLVVGGSSPTAGNTIDRNGEMGIGVFVSGNGYTDVSISDTAVTGTLAGSRTDTLGTGIYMSRSDSGLLTADLQRVISEGNEGNGLAVETQGGDKTDPNQPFSGSPNEVTVTDGRFDNNGLNGGFFRTRGDSTLVSDITRASFSDNGLNGIVARTSQNSSFGDPNVGVPPGRRSLFDGIVADNNGGDGLLIEAFDDSRALIEVTSSAAASGPGSHGTSGTLGDTSLSGNGANGIRIETTGGSSDILITSDGGNTTIDRNGVLGGGNGILWNASGDSDGIVRVTKTTISGSAAGASEDLNSDGILSLAEDINENGDIDVADGDGIQANFSENTSATLIIGNIGEGNDIRGNEDDGVAITATGDSFTGTPRPIIHLIENTIGGAFNGQPAGNGGDGVSLNVFGGTAVGIATTNVDHTLDTSFPIVSPNGGVTESGPVPQFLMTNNVITDNGARGVNLLLTGAAGTRQRDPVPFIFDPVRITIQENTIERNGLEGIYFRADANMNQSRFVYLANAGAPNDDNQNWLPGRPEFFNENFGTLNGNTSYMSPYLNLNSVQNTLLLITDNTIRNNGRSQVTGEGVRLEIGTGAYVAADVTGNAFGGNFEEDFVTASFLSSVNTFDSEDNSGINELDFVYLDDVAQLDLRFQNNSGNQILPTDLGAFYTNADPLKSQFFGALGVVRRDAAYFQVDNGPNLNSPNNIFQNFGITQDIQNSFNIGNYNIRNAAEPNWPNPGFLPFLP